MEFEFDQVLLLTNAKFNENGITTDIPESAYRAVPVRFYLWNQYKLVLMKILDFN
jgi:hypothetical protein